MVRQGLTLLEVVDATGLDERTIRSILRGTTRPHARTLHKLASGLGIERLACLIGNPIRGLSALGRLQHHPGRVRAHSASSARPTRARCAV